MKKISRVLILMLLTMIMVGCGNNKTFKSDEFVKRISENQKVVNEKVNAEGIAYIVNDAGLKGIYVMESFPKTNVPYKDITLGDIIAMIGIDNDINGFFISAENVDDKERFNSVRNGNIISVQGILGEDSVKVNGGTYFIVNDAKIKIIVDDEKIDENISDGYKNRNDELVKLQKEKIEEENKKKEEENKVKAEQKLREEVKNDINTIKDYIASKNKNEALKLIEDTIKKDVNSDEKGILLDLQKEANSLDTGKTDVSNSKSTKDEYIKKLENVSASLSDLDSLYESGVTADMVQAASTEFKRWDDLLNDIWAVLKAEMNEKDFEKLLDEQLSWIKNKEDLALAAAKEMEGGSMYNVIYTDSLAQTTKSRCYELVNKYMK